MAGASERSQTAEWAVLPYRAISSRVAPSASAPRAQIDTPPPASAKASAIARPIPRLPPATMARLPVMSIFMLPPRARPAQHAPARRATKGLTPMIKSVGLLTRKERLSHEDFVKHWVEVHAPLAHAVPGVRRYVQSHIVEERTRPDIPTTDVEIDGIAELWYADREAMERAYTSPEAKRLHADGALFIGRIKSFVVEEKVIIPRE